MKTMLIDVKSKPETCPKCGGKVVDIIYGMPAPETCERADRGEVMLGGCCIATASYPRITREIPALLAFKAALRKCKQTSISLGLHLS